MQLYFANRAALRNLDFSVRSNRIGDLDRSDRGVDRIEEITFRKYEGVETEVYFR